MKGCLVRKSARSGGFRSPPLTHRARLVKWRAVRAWRWRVRTTVSSSRRPGDGTIRRKVLQLASSSVLARENSFTRYSYPDRPVTARSTTYYGQQGKGASIGNSEG